MGLNPVLVIKTMDCNTIGVRARLYDDFVEHEIVLNSVLAYYWANNLPAAEKFIELFESVIKRTINELIPHKNLSLKYQVKANDKLNNASDIEIDLIEVQADDVGFKLDGKKIILKGLNGQVSDNEDQFVFDEIFEKSIETPDIVLKKYREMKD